MPFLTGVLLAIMGLLLASLHGRNHSNEKGGEEAFLRKFWGKGACSLAASFLYPLLLDPLGFVVATFLLIFALLKIMGTRKWIVPIFMSFLTVIASYFIFEVWLRINFPKGILGIG